nr:hypothetical protein [Tanacetum cinerariifolium]
QFGTQSRRSKTLNSSWLTRSALSMLRSLEQFWISVQEWKETVDVCDESETEPAKRRTASRRVAKKKVSIFIDDNIILNPDIALELGKSISITKAEEDEVVRQVYATHARIVTESVHEPAKKKTGSRSTKSVAIQYTPSASNSKPSISKPNLKGVQSLTLKE